ncbi:MAG TPA: TetR/AcrR family transcriptional regulator C-terminal ligand-binding domain-containing protein [Acidothermaceae bacterium]
MPAARLRSSTTLATAADKNPGVPLFRCRRRGLALESAIYDAVLQQLSTVGFGAMTMEGVAAAARTGKAAIYRRWPSKEELVADTLDNVLPSLDLPLDTGNVRSDLAAIFSVMLDMMASPAGGAMQALMGELGRDHDFVTTLHERVLAPRKALMTAILLRGVARGDVRADAVKPVVVDAGPALLMHRLLTFGPPVDPAYMEAVLDDVVMPLISPLTTSVASS